MPEKELPTTQKINVVLTEITDSINHHEVMGRNVTARLLRRYRRALENALTWDWEATCVYAMEGNGWAQHQYVTIIALCADGDVTQDWIDADARALAEAEGKQCG